ncbi:HAD-IA family hydrolase [Rhodospira trueperi]|uniref:Phosphoglycolate phosphatase n=1 Tax=Rhodospira trueperi TaxID=69960 RepID=A0A1G6XLK8_9PROT|nr:HAD-IA family hydrolase [Rhodospira trueperi]SDD78901.1 phosphoglycolate phosphatase [Rhodospira trueperi]
MMPATAGSGTLRLVVFDVDGTLVDSQHNIVEAMRMACAAVGLAAPSDEATRSVIGLSLGEAVARVTPGASELDRRRVEASYKEAFATLRLRPDHHEPLFPGVHAVLDALEAVGCVLGLATGKSRRGVASVIERHGLEGRFVTVRTADDGPGKPHPAMMREAMAEAGVEPDSTAMVGDTTFDIEMARAAGADPLGVAWGYHPPTALMAAGARLVLPDFAALPGCLSWSAGSPPRLAERA